MQLCIQHLTLIKFMLTHRTKIQKEWFLKCYILAAPSEIKISFLGHFSVMLKDTSIFLLRQNCNWYGVDCKKVHWTIHYFGSAKNVEKQKGSLRVLMQYWRNDRVFKS